MLLEVVQYLLMDIFCVIWLTDCLCVDNFGRNRLGCRSWQCATT